MNLIDVIDLKTPTCGCELYGFTKFPHSFDTIVGSSADLEDIEGAAFRDFLTNRVIRIEIKFWPLRAIQGLGKNASGRSLACSSGADKEIGVSEAILLNGIPKGVDDMILTENVLKGAGTVFACENLITHGANMGEERRFVSAEF